MEEWMEGDIDQMLARALLQSAIGNEVSKTHQELAIAIGSAREVISRHLKRFEQQGWIQLGRGKLKILDRDPLVRLAGVPTEFWPKPN
jgi:CRP/FNR family transcriptional regulator